MRYTLLFGLAMSIAACATAQSASSAIEENTESSDSTATSFSPQDTLLRTRLLTEATTVARERANDVLVVFAGSDWCRPCKQFERSVLSDTTFSNAAAGEVVVLYLDFPSKRRNQLPEDLQAQNAALAERWNPQGLFPKILLLNAHEEMLGELEFKGQSAEDFLGEVMALRSGQ